MSDQAETLRQYVRDNGRADMVRIASVDTRTGCLVADGAPIGSRETDDVYQLKLSMWRERQRLGGVR